MKLTTRNIVRHVMQRRFLYTIAAYLIIVGFVLSNSLYNRYKLYRENIALQEQIKNYEKIYNNYKRQLEDLENNPMAVEDVARAQLYMKTKNEDVYVIKRKAE